MLKLDSQKWGRRLKKLIVWGARAAWLMIFIYFLFAVVFSSSGRPKGDEKVGDLKVYNVTKDKYGEWERGEAIKFGFEQLAAGINYLFVAAAAIIGFISKMIIDPLIKPEGHKPLPQFALVLLRQAAWGSFLSVFYGFFGYLYFNKLPDSTDFSIYEEIGQTQLCQLGTFLMAVFLLLLAVTQIVNNRIRTEEEIKP